MSLLWLLEGIQLAAVQWPWAARCSSFRSPWEMHSCSFYGPQVAHSDFWQAGLEASSSFLKPFQSHSLSVLLSDSGLWIKVSGVPTVEILWIGDIRGDNAVGIPVFRKSLYFWLLMKLSHYRSTQEQWSRALFLPSHTCSSALFIRDTFCRCARPQKHTPVDKDSKILRMKRTNRFHVNNARMKEKPTNFDFKNISKKLYPTHDSCSLQFAVCDAGSTEIVHGWCSVLASVPLLNCLVYLQHLSLMHKCV